MSEEVYEPSKAEKAFEVLGRIANGMTQVFHIPVYLSWGFIGLFVLTLILVLVTFVENFIRWFRYLLIICWGLWVVALMIVIRYAPTIPA